MIESSTMIGVLIDSDFCTGIHTGQEKLTELGIKFIADKPQANCVPIAFFHK